MYSISKFYVIMNHYAIFLHKTYRPTFHTTGTGEKGPSKIVCVHILNHSRIDNRFNNNYMLTTASLDTLLFNSIETFFMPVVCKHLTTALNKEIYILCYEIGA